MSADAMLDHKKNEYAFGMTRSLEYDLRSQRPSFARCTQTIVSLIYVLSITLIKFMSLFTVLHSYTIRRSLTVSLVWDADGIMNHLAISRHWDEVLKNCQDLLDRRYEINRWLWREATRCYTSNSSNNSNNKNKQHKEAGCSIETKSTFIVGILV